MTIIYHDYIHLCSIPEELVHNSAHGSNSSNEPGQKGQAQSPSHQMSGSSWIPSRIALGFWIAIH